MMHKTFRDHEKGWSMLVLFALLMSNVAILLTPVAAQAKPIEAAASARISAPRQVAPADTTTIDADEPLGDDEIVYIGADERIYVYDPFTIGNNPAIKWVSPDDDWRAFDLGDFNNDGDLEIVAVGDGGTESGDFGKLAVYDPVVTDSRGADGEINGVPWRKLHERLIPGKPTLVDAGNFDPNIPGDEIAYGFLMNDDVVRDEGDKYRFTIIKSAIPAPDGTNWTDHISSKDDGNEWDYIESAALGDGGPDKIALIEEDGGEINVFKLGSGWERIFDDSSSSKPYRSVAFGDVYGGGYVEMVTSRRASSPLVTLIIYNYTPGATDGNEMRPDANALQFNPYPRVVWTTDANASGDDEIFFLRRDESPRLIARNYGDDFIPTLEEDLDGDDGYRNGIGGDFDADGRGEIAIIRDDNLRIYDYENGVWQESNEEVDAETNVLRAGDLDKAGFIVGPQFALLDSANNPLDPPAITRALEPGQAVQNVEYRVINNNSDDTIFFSWAMTADPDWVNVTIDKVSASENNPSRIYVSFDATGLLPGIYTTNLVLTGSNDDIINNPFVIPVELTVSAARIAANPSSAAFLYYPCSDTPEVRELAINLTGTPGVTYQAAVVERPALDEVNGALVGDIAGATVTDDGQIVFRDHHGNRASIAVPSLTEVRAADITWPGTNTWATATSEDGVIPDVITVRVDPAAVDGNYKEAVLIVVGDETAGNVPTNVRQIPITSWCVTSQIYLPSIRR